MEKDRVDEARDLPSRRADRKRGSVDMPKNLVKTKADEKKWRKAKKAAGSKYKGKTRWKVVNHIYQKMKGKK